MSTIPTLPRHTIMSSLLGIPCEVRLIIIEHVLNSPREAPNSPSNSNMIQLDDISSQNAICPQIFYEQREARLPSNCLPPHPLLLVNRQISAETQKVLDALKVSTTYKLDISIFDEYKLFPTWLSIPRLTNRVTTLHIDVRLFGHSPLCYGVRGLPRRTWFTRLDLGFEKCLTRFFLHGPQGEPSSYACGPLIIDNLTLDFRSAEDWLSSPPDKITYDDWLGQQGALDREAFASDGLDANTMYKTPPKWFAQCLSSAMFDDCEEEWLDEWDWLFSQVGVVKFLVEGKLLQQFDTAKELAKFGLEAQKRIRKKRKNLGLSLPGPEVEETTEDDTDESEG